MFTPITCTNSTLMVIYKLKVIPCLYRHHVFESCVPTEILSFISESQTLTSYQRQQLYIESQYCCRVTLDGDNGPIAIKLNLIKEKLFFTTQTTTALCSSQSPNVLYNSQNATALNNSQSITVMYNLQSTTYMYNSQRNNCSVQFTKCNCERAATKFRRNMHPLPTRATLSLRTFSTLRFII